MHCATLHLFLGEVILRDNHTAKDETVRRVMILEEARRVAIKGGCTEYM